jgi:hypothetical protein
MLSFATAIGILICGVLLCSILFQQMALYILNNGFPDFHY